MKYNLSRIMTRAWELFRKLGISFSECLHRSWLTAKAAEINEKRIRDAAADAGIVEPVNTWAGWKAAGRMVSHGSKALFKAVLIWGSRGDGETYTGSFFGFSQTEEVSA